MTVGLVRKAAVVAVVALLAGCVSVVLDVENKGIQPIPVQLVTEMNKNGMSPADPILIRIFKHESELEIWKRDRSGRFALLKTYPICRWAGQLGPKKREGDRQAPEGFYHVNASMLNPNSQYYLSFNLGYPNPLERALGYTGDALMVHGACTSAGCFALTDTGVAEIYAVVREALKGGQQSFQVQAFPFRMTSEKMALHRDDPNFDFWSIIKEGHDKFLNTRLPPRVSYCGGRYVFDAEFEGQEPRDPLAACPPRLDIELQALVAETDIRLTDVAFPVGDSMLHTYSDGGMHPVFQKYLRTKGAEALAVKTSLDRVPVSRPAAALFDPHASTE